MPLDGGLEKCFDCITLFLCTFFSFIQILRLHGFSTVRNLLLSGDIQRTTIAAVVKGSAAAAMPVRWLYRRGSQQTYSLPTS